MSATSDVARASVDVDLDVATAFDVFTAEIGDWYVVNEYTVVEHTMTKSMRIEPWVGGRFVDVHDLETGDGVVCGRVIVWDPPRRFVFVDARHLDVEVTFEPIDRGCRVTVEERGLADLSPEVARHVRTHGWHRHLPEWFHAYASRGDTAMTAMPKLGTLVPYLFYTDIEATIDWYTRVFGFVEKDRWRGADGKVHNAEMLVGDTELWMDGRNTGRHTLTDPDGNPFSLWIGVYLDDPAAVDAMYEHVVAEGVQPNERPADKPYGVRTFSVSDPEGYTWGFMCAIPRTDKE